VTVYLNGGVAKALVDVTDEELRELVDDGDSSPSKTVRGGITLSDERAARLLLQLNQLRDEARIARTDLLDAEQAISALKQTLASTEAEVAKKDAALRACKPDKVARRVEEARAAGAAEREQECLKLRAEVGRQQSEIEELRASKKKLREALERAKEGRR